MTENFQLIPHEYITESLRNRAPLKESVPLPLIEDVILCILEQLPIYDIFSFCLVYPETFGDADYVLKKKLEAGAEAELKFIFTSLFKGDFLGRPSKGFTIYSDVTEEGALGDNVRKYESEYSFLVFHRACDLYLKVEKNRLCERASLMSTKEIKIPKGYVEFERAVQNMTSKILKAFPDGLKIRWMEYRLRV